MTHSQKKAESNHTILMKKLRLKSLNADKKSDKQIIQNWCVTYPTQEADPFDKNDYLTCACSYAFCKRLRTIQNTQTEETLQVGTRCVQKFEKFREELKKIIKERKKQFKKEQMEKHNIKENVEYYINFKKSVLKVKIRVNGEPLKIKISAFGIRQQVGKITIDMENFKNILSTEEEYHNYNILKQKELDRLDVHLESTYQGKQIKELYRDENNKWIFLFTDKSTKTSAEIMTMKKEQILQKLSTMIYEAKQIKNEMSFGKRYIPKFSYIYGVTYYLQKFHGCDIASITNKVSEQVLMESDYYRRSIKQFNWIIRTLTKVKHYIIDC